VEATWNAQLELDLETDARRRVRRALAISTLAHVVVVVVMMIRPAPEPIALPPAITVDLVAAPPPAPPAAKPAPAPAPKPAPVAPPAPPQPKILPKRAPDALARPVEPKPAEPIRRRPRPKEMELGDAMAALRAELGEDAPAPESAEPAETSAATEAAPLAGEGTGTISPELRKWIAATTRHVQSVWVNPPEFVGRGLRTELRVELLADGTVVGDPQVLGTSGDPYADDNAVRALKKASPLPAPPEAGAHTFIFVPEARVR
jgi:TonB family protein